MGSNYRDQIIRIRLLGSDDWGEMIDARLWNQITEIKWLMWVIGLVIKLVSNSPRTVRAKPCLSASISCMKKTRSTHLPSHYIYVLSKRSNTSYHYLYSKTHHSCSTHKIHSRTILYSNHIISHSISISSPILFLSASLISCYSSKMYHICNYLCALINTATRIHCTQNLKDIDSESDICSPKTE